MSKREKKEVAEVIGKRSGQQYEDLKKGCPRLESYLTL